MKAMLVLCAAPAAGALLCEAFVGVLVPTSALKTASYQVRLLADL
jgi:hypothetical protein